MNVLFYLTTILVKAIFIGFFLGIYKNEANNFNILKEKKKALMENKENK